MKTNNSLQTAEILQQAYVLLRTINFSTAVSWADEVNDAIDHVQYAIDAVDKRIVNEREMDALTEWGQQDTPSLDTSFHDNEMNY